MSGGSFNYLYGVSDLADLREHRADLLAMVDALQHNYKACSSVMATANLLELLNTLDVLDAQAMKQVAALRSLWKAVEWHRSGDWSRESVNEALVITEAQLRNGERTQ